jgi:hypothetical protein
VCLHPSTQPTWPQLYACFVFCLLSFLHLLSPSVRFLEQVLEECKTHVVNFKISSNYFGLKSALSDRITDTLSFFFIILCCGYIVIFIKVLTIYQIYQS